LPVTSIKVYPNPVTEGMVFFENLDYEILELFDSDGCRLSSYDISGRAAYSIDVKQFPHGVYVYQLKTKDFLPVCGKIIVK
jgi:hypothetical protein